ncbi:MAG TPA: fibronectin type III domain-containing protein, partial [Thermoanaerobaculia bacterium]|nr:fibronectin type III domain-containing protein [Thermoanaerobaculia bacterium]
YVLRSSNNGPFGTIAIPITNSYNDTSLTAGTTYVYYVRAADDANIGPPSNKDLATTILFTDDPVFTNDTIVRAVHITELRTAVNAVRAAAGLSSAIFTDTIAAGGIMKALHITELRSNLDEVRAAIGVPAISYTDSSIAAGVTIIKAAHIRELRSGVK